MTDAESCCCQAAVPSQPGDMGTICGFCPFKGRTWLGQTNFLIPAVLALCGPCPWLRSWVEVAGRCLCSAGPQTWEGSIPPPALPRPPPRLR